jgi:hypothetical protein
MEAIREAQLQAAIEEVVDGNASGEALIAKVEHEEASVESFVTDRKNADTVVVYNQHTGESSEILLSMLTKQLRRRFPKEPSIPENLWGVLAFKIDPPKGLTESQMLLCFFHPDHPKREGFNEVGLSGVVCRKHNIPSEMAVEQHARKKHPQEMRIYETNMERVQAAEDRVLRRAEVAAMQQIAAVNNLMSQQPSVQPPEVENTEAEAPVVEETAETDE